MKVDRQLIAFLLIVAVVAVMLIGIAFQQGTISTQNARYAALASNYSTLSQHYNETIVNIENTAIGAYWVYEPAPALCVPATPGSCTSNTTLYTLYTKFEGTIFKCNPWTTKNLTNDSLLVSANFTYSITQGYMRLNVTELKRSGSTFCFPLNETVPQGNLTQH